MKVVGLDLSLTSTGVATVEIVSDGVAHVGTSRLRPISRGLVRLEWMVEAIHGYLDPDVDLVVVEGPSYGSTGRSQHERAGLWWLVAFHLWTLDRDVPVRVAIVPPSTRAKYGAGKGNAGKDDVLLAVARRYPTVNVRGNDEADALILAAMGARSLGHPIEDSLPEAHLEAMDRVVWPVAGGSSFPLHDTTKE